MSDGIKSSLSKYRVMGRIFLPPFLGENEIRKRRFGEMRIRRKGKIIIQKVKKYINYNDRWWEWEDELGIASQDTHERMDIENTAPQIHVPTKEDKSYDHFCSQCGHRWLGIESPLKCPKCDSRQYKSLRWKAK